MKFQTPRGTRDFLPEEMIRRQKVFDALRDNFERWGFDPLETPAFESWELLAAKAGGGEAIRDEIYYFRDKSNRELGLRFDLTVPLARVVAANPSLPKPFRRYHIGRVWRYDRPGTGRYREFWQADVDIIGAPSGRADAEIIAAACDCLEQLGLSDFRIRVSSRKLVESFLRNIGIKDPSPVFRSIDKLEKTGEAAVVRELKQKADDGKIQQIMEFIRLTDAKKVGAAAKDKEALNEVTDILSMLGEYGCSKYAALDMSLVRGLDYYTGTVFEISCGGMSIGGGGRYDNLIGLFGGKPSPAVGISFGIERIMEVMDAKKLFGAQKTATRVFIASIGTGVSESVALAKKLRSIGVQCEYDISGRSTRKQLDYANAKGVPYVIFLGPKELEKNAIKVRNMKTGSEREINMKNLEEIKSVL